MSPKRQHDLQLVLIGIMLGLFVFWPHLLIWPGP
jgi:hypothetical protein